MHFNRVCMVSVYGRTIDCHIIKSLNIRILYVITILIILFGITLTDFTDFDFTIVILKER